MARREGPADGGKMTNSLTSWPYVLGSEYREDDTAFGGKAPA